MTVFQMELELRPMLEEGLHGIEYDNVIERITERLVNSADVLFYWNIVSESWEEEVASTLMRMIVNLWITI